MEFLESNFNFSCFFAAFCCYLCRSEIKKRSCRISKFLSIKIIFYLHLQSFLQGELSEWLKEHAWKVCIRETVSRVRIPHSPQVFINNFRPCNFCGAFFNYSIPLFYKLNAFLSPTHLFTLVYKYY